MLLGEAPNTADDIIEEPAAAIGRFFVDQDPAAPPRANQIHEFIVAAAQACRDADETERVGHYQPILEAAVSELQECLVSHVGEVVVSNTFSELSPASYPELTEYRQVLNDEEKNRVVYVLPSEQITALSVNPQWYSNGQNVKPVINLRVLAAGAVSSDGQKPSLGKWYQIALETTELRLV